MRLWVWDVQGSLGSSWVVSLMLSRACYANDETHRQCACRSTASVAGFEEESQRLESKYITEPSRLSFCRTTEGVSLLIQENHSTRRARTLLSMKRRYHRRFVFLGIGAFRTRASIFKAFNDPDSPPTKRVGVLEGIGVEGEPSDDAVESIVP